MGCQVGRGMPGVLCALLLGALAWAAPASASIVVGDVQVGESGSATFTLTRDAGVLAGATSVSFQTADGSAASPSDYVGAGGTRAFGGVLFATTQTQQVAVAIQPDALDEPDETFRLVIAGAEVADGEAVATIADDDAPPTMSIADSPAVAEGAADAKASFAVGLSAPSGRPVSVAYATFDGDATAGRDYTARSGTLLLPAGSTRGLLDVAVLDDSAAEPTESFELRLVSPAAAATVGDGVASASILDDDEPPPAPVAKPATTTGSDPMQTGPSAQPPVGAPAGTPTTTGSDPPQTGPSAKPPVRVPAGTPTPGGLGLSSPRLKRPSTVLVTLSCPQSAGRCSGQITLFSIANPRSKIKALRRERRLRGAKFALQGGGARTLALALGRTDRALLRRSGRMRVRAYAVTRDVAGRTGVRSVSGTLIARTAHSSPTRP